jgi:hypothetical protein
VGRSIAACLEVNGILDMASSDRKDGIARFVRPLVDLKSFAAERKHLRHKRHAVELSVHVQGSKNFFLAADFDPIPCS